MMHDAKGVPMPSKKKRKKMMEGEMMGDGSRSAGKGSGMMSGSGPGMVPPRTYRS